MKKPQPRTSEQFDVDEFIGGAATATADRPPPPPKVVSRGKLPAEGFTRASFDLPDDLHERLKIAAVREKCPMRELVEEAIGRELTRLGH